MRRRITYRNTKEDVLTQIINFALSLDDFEQEEDTKSEGDTYIRAQLKHKRSRERISVEYHQEDETYARGVIIIEGFNPRDTTTIQGIGKITYQRIIADLEKIMQDLTERMINEIQWKLRRNKQEMQ